MPPFPLTTSYTFPGMPSSTIVLNEHFPDLYPLSNALRIDIAHSVILLPDLLSILNASMIFYFVDFSSPKLEPFILSSLLDEVSYKSKLQRTRQA